ncbi:MAG: hypothetical protein JNL79_14585 [Myxococcales bacterium]|nr:hypothetical protein [Myxococcales bacterium]
MRDDEILRRRARFVSAALLVAGCARSEGRTTIEPLGSTEKATGPSTPPSSVPASPPHAPKVAAPPDRPARTATVSATAAARRDAIVAHVDKIHRAIDELAAQIPALCKASDPACVAAWKDYFARLETTRDLNFVAPHCPPKGADELELGRLRDVHAAWHDRWLASIDKAVAKVLAESADGKVFGDLWGDARSAHARPCLSIACPP